MAKKVPMTAELKRLHKKFVPGNIVFFILGLVAMLAQLFMPFFDMRIHISGKGIASVLEQSMSSSGSASAITTVSTRTASASSEDEAMTSILKDALSDVELDIPINIYPMKMLKAANGTEEDVAEFMNSVIGPKGAEEFTGELVNSLAKPMLKASLTIFIDQAIAEADLTEEQKAIVEAHKEDVTTIVEGLMDGSPAKVQESKTTFLNVVKDVAATAGEPLSDEDMQEFSDIFDELVKMGTDDKGNFDLMVMLENFDPELLEGDKDDEASAPAAVIRTSTSTDESDAASSSEESSFGSIISTIQNPGQLIVDAMAESGVALEDMQTVFLVIFLLMAGIQAFFWGVFALSALLHIFTEKKNIRTRYVRLFCVWCGLGVLIGNVAMSALPKVMANMGGAGEAAGMITTIFEAFSIKFLGAGVVTGICWLIMFFFNLIYYRPIRKKIKKETKRLRKMMKRGEPIPQEEFALDEMA